MMKDKSEHREALHKLRHSAAHLLAHAVTELFPDVQVGIGPAIENGFYYDFLRDTPFTPEDLEAIEAKMRKLSQQDVPIERVMLPKEEAVKLFHGMGQDPKSGAHSGKGRGGGL